MRSSIGSCTTWKKSIQNPSKSAKVESADLNYVLTMNQLGEAAGTDPEALHFVPERKEIVGIFAGSAAEAVNGDVFFLGLGFCFFSIKFDGVSFLN